MKWKSDIALGMERPSPDFWRKRSNLYLGVSPWKDTLALLRVWLLASTQSMVFKREFVNNLKPTSVSFSSKVCTEHLMISGISAPHLTTLSHQSWVRSEALNSTLSLLPQSCSTVFWGDNFFSFKSPNARHPVLSTPATYSKKPVPSSLNTLPSLPHWLLRLSALRPGRAMSQQFAPLSLFPNERLARQRKKNSPNNNILLIWVPGKNFQTPFPPAFSCPCPPLLHTLPFVQKVHLLSSFQGHFSIHLPLLRSLECLYLAWGSFYLRFWSLFLGGYSQISLHLENCLELEWIWLCHISVQIKSLILSLGNLLLSQCVVHSNFMVKSKAKQSPF